MNSQHFYGPVEQVAGATIVNHYDREAIEERRRLLIERYGEHALVRDAAARRANRHPCCWITILAFIAVGMTGMFELRHPAIASWLWPIQLVLIVAGGATLFVFERIRRDCRVICAEHTEAMAEINRVLYTL